MMVVLLVMLCICISVDDDFDNGGRYISGYSKQGTKEMDIANSNRHATFV